MTEKTTTTPAAIEPEGLLKSGRAAEEPDAEGHVIRPGRLTEDAPEAEGLKHNATEGHGRVHKF